MNNLIKFAIRYKSITLFCILLVLTIGTFSFIQLPQNEDPPIVPGLVKVFTYWPGATPEDVETYISKPLEKAVSKYDNISYQKSESLAGVSILTVRMSDNVSGRDVDMGYQKLRNYIGDIRATLPGNIVGPFILDRLAETEAFVIGISSESGNRTYRELQSILDNVRDELKTVEGVGDCQFYGDQPEKVFIDLSTDDLAALGIHPGQIIDGIKTRNVNMAQPYLNISGKQLFVEVTGLYKSIDQIRDTIIYTDPTGKIYRVKDLNGQVKLAYDDPPQWEAKVDQKKSIILTVSMKRGFHIVRWGNKIDKKLEEIRKQLPADVKLQTLYNQPVAVQHSVDKFLKSFIEAIILVIIILGIGLGLRNAGIVALAIPLIVLATFAVMNCLKIELHQMSISALIIVLGMIVDNSVVVIDNIERYLQLGYSKVEASIKGTLEVSSALFSGTAAIVTAFLVLTFVSGSLGEYIRALPMVICISLIVSYFVALLVSPPLASILAKSHVKNGDEKDSEKDEITTKSSLFRRIYYKFVDLTQRFKAFTLFTLLGMFVASLYMAANYIPISFFPPADKSQFLVNVFLPEGSDIYATRDRVALIEKKLEQMKKEIPQEQDGKGKDNGKPLVSSYVTYLGQSGPRFFIAILPRAPMNRYAHIMVTTPDGKQTRKAAQELREFLNSNLPGAIVDIILLETGPPVDYPIEVRISGNDIKNLQEIGRKVEDILAKTNGIVSMSNDYGVNSQKIVVKVDQDRAKMLGISSSDVAAGLYTGLQGYPVTKLNAPERQIDVVLRMEKNKRQTVDDLKAVLFVSSLTGKKHRLDEFADVLLDTYPSAIMRRNEQRTLSVCSFVKGRLPDEVLKEIKPQIADIKLPYGYKITYGGQSEETDKAFSQLVPLVLLGFTLMFLILAFKFKSIKIALAIYMSLPMALIGAVIGMFVMKQSFGFMSAIGLTSLGGIVVYNAIVIVEFIHNNLKSGKETLEAIKEAGFIRIRPILMTATCAIGGLLPLAMSGTPLFEPLCWVIIFGLAFSTIMTLLMTPLFYVVFGGVADSMRIIENEKLDEKALSDNSKD